MPTYNAESTLEKSIGSVLAQSCNDFEIIVVDDNSTDGSVEIVRELALTEPRIKLIEHQSNLGAGVARSTGIKNSKGRFIAFLDADDLWKTKKLEKQISYMIDSDCYFCCSWYDIQTVYGDRLGTRKPPRLISYEALLYENVIGCLTVMIDTDFFGRRSMPYIRKRQDYAFWLSLLREVDYCFCLQESLSIYQVRPNSISSNKLEMIAFNYKMFRQCEKFGITKSTFYVVLNILNKIYNDLFKKY